MPGVRDGSLGALAVGPGLKGKKLHSRGDTTRCLPLAASIGSRQCILPGENEAKLRNVTAP